MKRRKHLLCVVFPLGFVGITAPAQKPTGSDVITNTDLAKLRLHEPIQRVCFHM
jgi:hypothetical protein